MFYCMFYLFVIAPLMLPVVDWVRVERAVAQLRLWWSITARPLRSPATTYHKPEPVSSLDVGFQLLLVWCITLVDLVGSQLQLIWDVRIGRPAVSSWAPNQAYHCLHAEYVTAVLVLVGILSCHLKRMIWRMHRKWKRPRREMCLQCDLMISQSRIVGLQRTERRLCSLL